MIHRPQPYDPDAPIVVIDIGNTSIHIGSWHENMIRAQLTLPAGDQARFEEAFAQHVRGCPNEKSAAVVVASVVPSALEWIAASVLASVDRRALVVGDDVPLPMEVDVEDGSAIGVDRVCNAAAAYEQFQTACAVVDFGSAVTVDMISDEGVLAGGAILPGLAMQMRSLHEHTAKLPLAECGVPQHPYGRNTIEAIQAGVCGGLAGAVRGLIERYAASLNQWPQVVATGGDLEFMVPLCDYLDSTVSGLTLRGIGLAYSKHLASLGA